MEIPADIVGADGHLVPGQYDCRKAGHPQEVKPTCVYFYFNGVRYEAEPLPKEPTMAEILREKVANDKPSGWMRDGKGEWRKDTCFAGTPAQLAKDMHRRQGYLKGFADAKALLAGVQPSQQTFAGAEGTVTYGRMDIQGAEQLQEESAEAPSSKPFSDRSWKERFEACSAQLTATGEAWAKDFEELKERRAEAKIEREPAEAQPLAGSTVDIMSRLTVLEQHVTQLRVDLDFRTRTGIFSHVD